jgi:hypothetical protein
MFCFSLRSACGAALNYRRVIYSVLVGWMMCFKHSDAPEVFPDLNLEALRTIDHFQPCANPCGLSNM